MKKLNSVARAPAVQTRQDELVDSYLVHQFPDDDAHEQAVVAAQQRAKDSSTWWSNRTQTQARHVAELGLDGMAQWHADLRHAKSQQVGEANGKKFKGKQRTDNHQKTARFKATALTQPGEAGAGAAMTEGGEADAAATPADISTHRTRGRAAAGDAAAMDVAGTSAATAGAPKESMMEPEEAPESDRDEDGAGAPDGEDAATAALDTLSDRASMKIPQSPALLWVAISAAGAVKTAGSPHFLTNLAGLHRIVSEATGQWRGYNDRMQLEYERYGDVPHLALVPLEMTGAVTHRSNKRLLQVIVTRVMTMIVEVQTAEAKGLSADALQVRLQGAGATHNLVHMSMPWQIDCNAA